MKHNTHLTLNIKGRNWHFILYTDKQYDKKFKEDDSDDEDCATTDPAENTVYFRRSKFNLPTIRHELMHVVVFSSLVESSDLSRTQMEDLCCEIVGEHGLEICNWAEEIMNFYTKSGVK